MHFSNNFVLVSCAADCLAVFFAILPKNMDFKAKLVGDIENCLENGKFNEAVALINDTNRAQELKFNCNDLTSTVTKYLTDANFKQKPELFGACEKLLQTIAAKANKEDALFEFLELLETVKTDELLISLLKSLQVVLLRMNHRNSQVNFLRAFL